MPTLDSRLSITNGDLVALYKGTEDLENPEQVFSTGLASDLAELDDNDNAVTDNRLQRLFESKVIVGKIGVQQDEIRSPEQLIDHLSKVAGTYPWLGKLMLRGVQDDLTPAAFESSVGNHAFDDSPLPYGISKLEGHTLRGFMENDITNFRSLASDKFPPYKPSSQAPFDQDTDKTEMITEPSWLKSAQKRFRKSEQHLNREEHKPRNRKIGAVVLAGIATVGVATAQLRGSGILGHWPKATTVFIQDKREALREEKNYDYQQANAIGRYQTTYIDPPFDWPKYQGTWFGKFGELWRHDTLVIASKTNSCLQDTPYDLDGYTPEGQTERQPGAHLQRAYGGIVIIPANKRQNPPLAFNGLDGDLGDLQPIRPEDKQILARQTASHIECLSTPYPSS